MDTNDQGRVLTLRRGRSDAKDAARLVYLVAGGETDAPDVLKAAATAMRHKGNTQASSRYDDEANDRLVNAAVEYTTAFAKTLQPPCAPQSDSGGGGGGSGDGGGDSMMPFF